MKKKKNEGKKSCKNCAVCVSLIKDRTEIETGKSRNKSNGKEDGT